MSKAGCTWLARPMLAEAPLREWLIDRGSLTARIRARCSGFAVDVLDQRTAAVPPDEARLIGVMPPQRALVREVVLRCHGRPLVYAHSVLAPMHVRGPWRLVSGLGARPLGAVLFTDRTIERRPLAFRRLGRHHPLYCAATRVLGDAPTALWARRSLFLRGRAPLLVTEVFLPEILRLAAPSTEAHR